MNIISFGLPNSVISKKIIGIKQEQSAMAVS